MVAGGQTDLEHFVVGKEPNVVGRADDQDVLAGGDLVGVDLADAVFALEEADAGLLTVGMKKAHEVGQIGFKELLAFLGGLALARDKGFESGGAQGAVGDFCGVG